MVTFCLLVEKARYSTLDLAKLKQTLVSEMRISYPSQLTSQFRTCWHRGPSWACSPFPSVAPWWRRCWGSEHMEPRLWFQSNGCCCHPVEKLTSLLSLSQIWCEVLIMLQKKWIYLPTEVNNIGVWVIEGQEHSVAGVHLINSHGLLHVLLKIKKSR